MKSEINRIFTPEKNSSYPKTQNYDNLVLGLSQVLADTYTLQQQIEQSQDDPSGQLSSSVQAELKQEQQDLETATDAIAERIFTIIQPATPGTEITRPSYVPAVESSDSRSQTIEHLAQGNEMLYKSLLEVLSLAKAQENSVISSFLSQRAEIHQNNAQTLRSFL